MEAHYGRPLVPPMIRFRHSGAVLDLAPYVGQDSSAVLVRL